MDSAAADQHGPIGSNGIKEEKRTKIEHFVPHSLHPHPLLTLKQSGLDRGSVGLGRSVYTRVSLYVSVYSIGVCFLFACQIPTP